MDVVKEMRMEVSMHCYRQSRLAHVSWAVATWNKGTHLPFSLMDIHVDSHSEDENSNRQFKQTTTNGGK
jgi:hypothetical protein